MTILKIDDIIANGATAEDVANLPKISVWPKMAPEAYHGLAGRIVRAIEGLGDRRPQHVTAIAVEHVTLLVIPAHRLESMVRANPELAIGLICQLARMAAHRND
jgi:CRP-like cAMP-binding protein